MPFGECGRRAAARRSEPEPRRPAEALFPACLACPIHECDRRHAHALKTPESAVAHSVPPGLSASIEIPNEQTGIFVWRRRIKAAVLARESISRTEMLSNQLWGGLQVVGGVLEMVGAGVLCVMPEPTMASKIGCVAFGAHGSDTVAAGLRQIWTGLDTATLTRQGTTKLAEVLNVDPAMADNIGLSIDIAVPFGFAGSLKAARAAQVTMGRIRLEMHEARAGSRVGGHTIAKHVGRTEAQLRERLMHEPDIRAVSSFVNLEQAEWAISRVLQIHAQGIQAWAHGPGRRAPLTLMQRIAGNIGYGIVRKEGKLKRMNRVKVVLKFESHNDMPHYVVTAYLE